MDCQHCGAKNLEHKKICWKCGTALSDSFEPSTNFQCHSCGSQIPDPKDRYCPNCLQIINRDLLIKPINEQKNISPLVSTDILMRFEGNNGQIELYKEKIIIKRAGLTALITQGLTKGEKTIYINQITGIQLKLGGILVGYIQFTLPGGIESKKGVMDAQHDENSVTFSSLKNDQAVNLKEKVEELMLKLKQSPVQMTSISNADEIRKFKQLFDDGIITEEEFNKKKKELLGF